MLVLIKRLFYLIVLTSIPALPVFLLVWALAIDQYILVTIAICATILIFTSLMAEHIVRFSNANAETRYQELPVIRKRILATGVRLDAKILVTSGKPGKVEYFRSLFSDGLVIVDVSVLDKMTFEERVRFFIGVLRNLRTGSVYLRTIAAIWKKISIRSFNKADVDFQFGSVNIKRLAPLGFLRLLLSYPWIYLIDQAYFAFDNAE